MTGNKLCAVACGKGNNGKVILDEVAGLIAEHKSLHAAVKRFSLLRLHGFHKFVGKRSPNVGGNHIYSDVIWHKAFCQTAAPGGYSALACAVAGLPGAYYKRACAGKVYDIAVALIFHIFESFHIGKICAVGVYGEHFSPLLKGAVFNGCAGRDSRRVDKYVKSAEVFNGCFEAVLYAFLVGNINMNVFCAGYFFNFFSVFIVNIKENYFCAGKFSTVVLPIPLAPPVIIIFFSSSLSIKSTSAFNKLLTG